MTESTPSYWDVVEPRLRAFPHGVVSGVAAPALEGYPTFNPNGVAEDTREGPYLHFAALRIHFAVCRGLVALGAAMHTRDFQDGTTVLHAACSDADERRVELLGKVDVSVERAKAVRAVVGLYSFLACG